MNESCRYLHNRNLRGRNKAADTGRTWGHPLLACRHTVLWRGRRPCSPRRESHSCTADTDPSADRTIPPTHTCLLSVNDKTSNHSCDNWSSLQRSDYPRPSGTVSILCFISFIWNFCSYDQTTLDNKWRTFHTLLAISFKVVMKMKT